ncbi:hypothetical protein [Metabacillus bambusae]|uniref:TrbC/VirB2 family protein n=1 Tax=Metabacillus bambusae TaxID=2795218 RepID=A0ABS3N9W4_9BACI|nr:hypothetical protein [Metabacillus bambusae]MBO1515076.1 hypothetical protein [Metabacillus bambusae]
MRTQSMTISEFMSGEYKVKKRSFSQMKTAAASVLPLSLLPTFASAQTVTPEVVPAGATEWMSEKALQTIAHALDPLVDIMVALSFPVASVIIMGACFFFMLGKSERAWSTIMNCGLGYVLIQVMPLLLNVLKEVGGAI